MIYKIDCLTPANTEAATPVISPVRITKGLVYRIEIVFPPGCAGLCHLVITDGLYQAWPSSPSETFHADNESIGFEDTYLKLNPPYSFSVITYNLDETFDHTPIVRIGMVSQEIFIARFLPSYSYKYFLEILDKLQKQQEEQAISIIDQPFMGVKPSEEILRRIIETVGE